MERGMATGEDARRSTTGLKQDAFRRAGTRVAPLVLEGLRREWLHDSTR
jgi:hypothetical protein